MKGELFILSAPAGGGKTTITNLLLKEIPNLTRVITCTTRNPREGEVNGKDYIFLSKEEFEQGIKEGKFLEYAVVHGNYYGTPKEEVEKLLNEGKDVILVIDVQGMRQIKGKIRPLTTIFLIPPSIEELVNRMKKRGDSPEEIQKRLETAKKEFPAWKEYDYIVINDILEDAKEKIKTIILAQKNKTERFEIFVIKDNELRKLMENA
ncbi:guanylate kinase [Hydrogenivirga sp. 128-5-R1-1]|uniref:guanylate kinase n=1 Tax=Hydrogenivirga sp. 128-5-R1-1 TaxID=392423 RepID=UPI00015F0DAB|nr:guanylate kinase [Hydrogenivirga sp. 128-5-R1-1]EDP74126.1 guanylate kinase [Hydrogenivirga sp. 128-5-R1-1]